MFLRQAGLGQPLLPPGATIAVIAPSGPVPPDRLEAGLAVLRGWGYQVRLAPNLFARSGHTAGSAAHRAQDLDWALNASRAQCVWIARGGTGAGHLLPALAGLVRGHGAGAGGWRGPGVLIGFSDTTALLSGLLRDPGDAGSARMGVVIGVHGPVITSLGDNTDANSLLAMHDLLVRGASMHCQVTGELAAPIGPAPAVGGNLSVLASLVGTPDQVALSGRVVILEDVDEPNRKLDRMLTQLAHGGSLGQAAAVALGTFSRTDGQPRPHWEQFVHDWVAELGVPVVRGLPVGHTPANHPWITGQPTEIQD